MRSPRLSLTCLAATVAVITFAVAIPASAQRGTIDSSWEGATHDMQVRGPHSTTRGPTRDGRIVVTGTRGWGGHAYGYRFSRHHRRAYYGMAR